MSIKYIAYGIGRVVTKLILLSSILLGSCAGLGVAHNQSAFWTLAEIDSETARRTNKFFVAFVEQTTEDKRTAFALPYRTVLENPKGSKRSFRFADGKTSLDIPPGNGRVTVISETDEDQLQTTTVHAIGDTPWVSVSEYQVQGETIIPRRFGHGVSALLIAILIVPILLTYFLQRPVRRIAECLFPGESSPDAK